MIAVTTADEVIGAALIRICTHPFSVMGACPIWIRWSSRVHVGNMIDLNSNPTKLIEIVEIGKQLLMTRGSLTTFSISNDVTNYFAIIPAIFITIHGVENALEPLNEMRLHSPQSAILASVIFNALVIVALIPLALRGVKYLPSTATGVIQRNLLVYGVGGLIVPCAGIKLINLVLVALRLV